MNDLSASSGLEPGVILVFDQAGLDAALAAATGGETIRLAPGTYDGFRLSGADFTEAVTVESADPLDPAIFTGAAKIVAVSGLTLAGVAFVADGETETPVNRISVTGSERIELSDITIVGATWRGDHALDGWPRDYGVVIDDSTGVTLTGLDVTHLYKGVVIRGSDGVSIAGSEFHEIRSDGVNIVGSSDVLIEDNHFRDFLPWYNEGGGTGDHPDFIQYMGDKDGRGIDNLVIRDNAFIQTNGNPIQAIFGHESGRPSPFTNFTVTGNLIQTGQLRGISLGGVVGGEIGGNILIPAGTGTVADGSGARPAIFLSGGSDGAAPQDFVIHDNIITLSWQKTFDPTGNGEEANAARNIALEGNIAIDQGKGIPEFWASVRLPDRADYLDQEAWMEAAFAELRAQLPDDVAALLPAEFGLAAPAGVRHAVCDWGQAVSDLDFAAGEILHLGGDATVEIRSLDELFAHAMTTGLRIEITGDRSLRLIEETAEGSRAFEIGLAEGVSLKAFEASTITAIRGETFVFDIAGVLEGGARAASGAEVWLADGQLHYRAEVATDGPRHLFDRIEFVAMDADGGYSVGALKIAARGEGETTITGGDGRDKLSGGIGDDVLIGGAGKDTLFGYRDDDWLEGGAGADRIVGGPGSDIAFGGDGADKFLFSRKDGRAGDHDIVGDLDFAEGDLLHFLDFGAGRFSAVFENVNKAGTLAVRDVEDFLALDEVEGFSVGRLALGEARLTIVDGGVERIIDVHFDGDTVARFEALWPLV